MEIPKFETKKELFAWLKDNEEDILYKKKSQFKKADGFTSNVIPLSEVANHVAFKDVSNDDERKIKVRVIINTTMVRDSHKDVHIDGIWNKTVKENKKIKHLQEHEMKFDKIISDKEDLRAFVKTYNWRDLGYDADGTTQALVFDSTIKELRNPYMYYQYKNGNVDNHSVGMYYVDIKTAINSDDEEYAKYKAEYDKHIDNIVNKAEVEKDGFFFAVYEAKAIEGSAVPIGSNQITPTLNVSKDFEVEEEISEADKQLLAIKEWLGRP